MDHPVQTKSQLLEILLKIHQGMLPGQTTCADWLDLEHTGTGIPGDVEINFEEKDINWIQNIMIYDG